MHHPLPNPHSEGMILGYLQIIHRPGPRHHLPPGHYAHTAIRPQEVHAQRDLAHWQEAVLYGEKGVLLIGMDHLARLSCLAVLSMSCGRDGQVHQVVVVVDLHVQDGLRLHLAGLGVVGQHALPDWRPRQEIEPQTSHCAMAYAGARRVSYATRALGRS